MKSLFSRLTEWWDHQNGIRELNRRKNRFSRACKMADRLTLGDRKTRYVIERNGGFIIFSTSDIDRMKAKRVFRADVNIFTLLKQASYISTISPEMKKNFDLLHPKKK